MSPLSWKHTTRIRFVERMPGITPEVTIGPIPENQFKEFNGGLFYQKRKRYKDEERQKYQEMVNKRKHSVLENRHQLDKQLPTGKVSIFL